MQAVATELGRPGCKANLQVAAAHREAMESLKLRGNTTTSFQIHRLLAEEPLRPVNDVYRSIFVDILGQRLSQPEIELDHVEQAVCRRRPRQVADLADPAQGRN